MDFITTTLGLQLLPLKARDCLQQQWNRDRVVLDVNHRGKVVWGFEQEELWMRDVPDKASCYDDETASTLSESDDNSMLSSSDPLSSSVTFAPEVISAVYIRPYTERHEKSTLYYNENDYRQFRMDYRRSLYRRGRPGVTFSPNVVSHIHVLPVVENKEDVYYSSSELKQFLEDFIMSLDDKNSA